MHETTADLAALQNLLDRSYETAGQHLLSIITPQRRLNADQVADRLRGVCLLANLLAPLLVEVEHAAGSI